MFTFYRSEPWSRRSRSWRHRFLGALEPEPSECDGSATLVKTKFVEAGLCSLPEPVVKIGNKLRLTGPTPTLTLFWR